MCASAWRHLPRVDWVGSIYLIHRDRNEGRPSTTFESDGQYVCQPLAVPTEQAQDQYRISIHRHGPEPCFQLAIIRFLQHWGEGGTGSINSRMKSSGRRRWAWPSQRRRLVGRAHHSEIFHGLQSLQWIVASEFRRCDVNNDSQKLKVWVSSQPLLAMFHSCK